MTKGAKITVAGAGALGLTTALALADAGAQVTVYDPAGPGDNASGVAAGMLAPIFEAVLDAAAAPHFDLLLAARDLWPALEARIGVVVDRSGAVATGDLPYLAGVDLATDHAAKAFSDGTASGGVTFSGQWLLEDMSLLPYFGLFADYRFEGAEGTTTTGLEGRVQAGVRLNVSPSAAINLGGELGGLGSEQRTWSLNAGVSGGF